MGGLMYPRNDTKDIMKKNHNNFLVLTYKNKNVFIISIIWIKSLIGPSIYTKHIYIVVLVFLNIIKLKKLKKTLIKNFCLILVLLNFRVACVLNQFYPIVLFWGELLLDILCKY